MEDARELRKLAEWYRAFAEVGNSADHQSRLEFAAYLESRANALEKRTENDPKKAWPRSRWSKGIARSAETGGTRKSSSGSTAARETAEIKSDASLIEITDQGDDLPRRFGIGLDVPRGRSETAKRKGSLNDYPSGR